MSAVAGLAGFVALCLLAYAVGAGFAGQGRLWFAAMQRPAWVPANTFFAPFAGVVYLLLGVGGWRIWARFGPARLLRLWGWQLLLNAAWVPAMFGSYNLGVGLLLIVPGLFAALAMLRQFAAADGRSAILMVPYVFWIVYCTGVTAGYWWLNGR